MNHIKNTQLMNLDFLRIVFTLIVIAYHFIRKLGIWNEGGGYVVEFFFVLSGFLIVYRFNPDMSVLTFLKKKIVRFIPIIAVSGIAVCFWIGRFNPDFWRNIFLIPVSEQLLVLVAWYINVLVWVSVFYFALLKYITRPHACLIIGVLTFMSLYMMIATNTWITDGHLGKEGTIGYVFSGNLLRGLAGIGVGCLLAQSMNLKDTEYAGKKMAILGYTLAEICVFGWLLGAMYVHQLYIGPLALLLGFTALIYLFVIQRGLVSRILNKPCYSQIARYTLCIYLMQEVIVRNIFPYLLNHYNHFVRMNQILTIGGTLLICVIVGIIVYYVIEKPITHYCNKSTQLIQTQKREINV